jgi:hypothetical protein
MLICSMLTLTVAKFIAADNETTSKTKLLSRVHTSTCVGHGELSLGRPGSDANSLAARALHMS